MKSIKNGEVLENLDMLYTSYLYYAMNSYEWLMNNPDQLHPYLNYLLSKMTKEQFEGYKLSYEQIVNRQFERMEEDEDYDMLSDSSDSDKLNEILQLILAEE